MTRPADRSAGTSDRDRPRAASRRRPSPGPGHRRPQGHVHRPRRRTAIDRSAVVTGRFRYDALAASDFPAVGDWVALEPTRPEAGPTIPRSSRPSCRAGRRSCAAPPMPAGARPATSPTSRSSRPTSTSRSSSPGLDHDFNLRRLERYLAVAWSSGVDPVIVLNKADIADDLEGRLVAVAAIAPGVPVVVLSALTGDHLADLGEYLARRPDRGRARVVGRRQVDPRQRPARRGAPGDRGGPRRRLARPAHDDPPRAVRQLPGGALLIDTPGHPLAGDRRRRRGRRDRVRRHHRAGPACRFSDCRHQGEPGCAVRGGARRTGRSARTGWPASRSSSASSPSPSARATRGPRPRSASAGRPSTSRSASTWTRKYGGDGWR